MYYMYNVYTGTCTCIYMYNNVYTVCINMCAYKHNICACTCNIYVRDGYTTRPVLKPSDGFKAGPTALNPARRLDIRPDGFEAGPTAC